MKNVLKYGTVLAVTGVLMIPATVFAYENLSLGEEITINGYNPTDYDYSALDGTFSIAIDGFHYVKEVSGYQDPGVGVVGVLCSVNNIDAYQTYWDSKCISSYDISQFLTVKDGDGYNCEFYNLDAPADGKYQIGKDIDMGSKARVCMTYYTDPEIKDYTIILNDEYIMNVSLDENGEGVFMEEETAEDVENSSELTEETPEGKDEFVLLYNQDGYKVEATGFDIRKNSFQLKFTNLTHHDIRVSVVDGYINGVMNGIDFSERVLSGKSGIGKATISKNELVSAGIDVIDDVSFSIKVDNAEDSSATLTTIGVMHFSLVEGKIDTSIVYSDTETIRQVQEMLNKLGYDCGAADGIAGKNTNSRILQFENEHGLKETTDISDELLEALKELAG